MTPRELLHQTTCVLRSHQRAKELTRETIFQMHTLTPVLISDLRRKLTLRQIAKRINRSPLLVADWEKGIGKITETSFEQLVELLRKEVG